MKKRLISLMVAALALLSASGQVSFTNVGEHHVIEVTPEMNTGLNKIFVVYNTQGVAMNYTATSNNTVTWYSYETHGGYAEPIAGITHAGAITTLSQVLPNRGYIIEEGTDRYYCWVVNYDDYYLSLNDMFINDENPCTLLSFNIDGQGPSIYYYTIHGIRQVLDREIKLSYNTLVWSDDAESWGNPVAVVDTFPALDQGIEIEPPLCNTGFLLSGDRFQKDWHIDEPIGIEDYQTKAVNCNSTAYFLDEDGNYLLDDQGNKTKLDGELSGGSAPVRILFTGHPTDAVAYRLWEIARDQNFEDVILQYYQDEVDYTFMDAGNYYVRYMVANDVGSCENYANSYTVNVSESQLGSGPRGDLPNVFSPGTTWRVAHKSLVEFHCWIFNRWGNLVYEYTDPDGGWDGTYHGKPAETGVYYCVVTALGSDGVKYKKRGDITILRYFKSEGTSNGAGTEGGD